MRATRRSIIAMLASLSIMAALAGYGLWRITARGEIIVASKSFTESRILMEIMAQAIEANTGATVDRRDLGSTSLCYDALWDGAIDLYPEYTGTLLTEILGLASAAEPAAALERVNEALAAEGRLEVLGPFGFNDTFVLAMRADVAAEKHIATISDLVRHPELKAGFTSEFNQRSDGYRGLAKHYGLRFNAAPVDLAPGHMYAAVADGHVQVISAFSTDARIRKFRLALLADDKNFFPAYQAVILLRSAFARAHPEVVKVLRELGGRIDNETMLHMNYQADIEGIPAREVARRFLERASEAILHKGEDL